jgi:stalled ribosome rescue protein Dom34
MAHSCADENRAVYGVEHVKKAADAAAISTLMILDRLIRSAMRQISVDEEALRTWIAGKSSSSWQILSSLLEEQF